MHRTSYFAFLLFYVVPTGAISQERAVMIAAGQRSSPTDDRARLDAGMQEPQGFPNQSEAKPRGGSRPSFGKTKSILKPPDLKNRCLQPQIHLAKEEAR